MKKHENHHRFSRQQGMKRGMGPGPGGPLSGEKAKDFKGVMLKLLKAMGKQKKLVIIAFICAMLGSILTLVGPNRLTALTDEITSGIASSMMVEGMEKQGVPVDMLLKSGITLEQLAQQMGKTVEEFEKSGITMEKLQSPGIDFSAVWALGAFLIVMYILSYIFSVLQGVILSDVLQNTAKRFRKGLADKIDRLPMGFFAKITKGEVLSRITNDVDTTANSLSQSMGTLISSLTLLVGSVFMMTITNFWLALTAVVSTMFGFGFMLGVIKKSQKFFANQQKYLGQMNGHIEEMYTGHTIVKAYNGEKRAIDTFDGINKKYQHNSFRAQAIAGLMMPMMGFVGNFGYVNVCVVGALLAFSGHITFGVIVAFMVYIRLFTQPLTQIAQAMQNMQSGAAAGERIFEFLEESEMPSETDKTKKLTNIKGEVTFQNVHFGYDEEKTIINDFSATAKPGQKIAIVGPTGAGKTTMVNLLMRFYDVQSGDILIDGVSIKEMKREDVHDLFCMVLQDTWLFEGTIRENLCYTSQSVTKEELVTACKAVGLHHYIKTLPKGYDTVLNETTTLSQGQKQQMTIARAMIANKPMLILDEATSSVDTRTELSIQKAMDSLMANRTSFVIAHRLSTIKNADIILVMKDGDIVEMGSHETLLEQQGFYATLYNAQFENNA